MGDPPRVYTAAELARYLADLEPGTQPSHDFWKLYMALDDATFSRAKDALGYDDIPIGTRKRNHDSGDGREEEETDDMHSTSRRRIDDDDSSDDDVGVVLRPRTRNRGAKRILDFDSNDDDYEPAAGPARDDDDTGDLGGFIVDDHEGSSDETGDDVEEAEEADDVPRITPDDVGRFFEIGVKNSKRPEYIQLVDYKDNDTTHLGAWLYHADDELIQWSTLPEAMRKTIRRVKKIGGIPLFLSDHTQSLKEDVGGWKDVTDNTLMTRVIPRESVDPINLFILGEYDLDTKKLKSDVGDSVDLVVDRLLSLGPQQGKWIKRIAPKITEWKKVHGTRDTCVACDRFRHVSMAFKYGEIDAWHKVGRFCGDRIKVACKLINCDDEEEKRELIMEASEALQASSH
jgi:hypothetical protein